MAETVSGLLNLLGITQSELLKTFSDDDFLKGIDHYFEFITSQKSKIFGET